MSKVYESLLDLVGNTPIIRFNNYKLEKGLCCNILGKIEAFNPGGSIKDRIAKNMITEGIREGLIKGDSVLIEPTSGNTGIGLAMVAASKGLKLILTMPETMSVERRNIIKAYGAEIVLTEGAKGMKGAIAKAQELSQEIPGSVVLEQFKNPNNPGAHINTTAVEIIEAFDSLDEIDYIVMGVGTGGTLTGVSKVIKAKNNKIKIVAVEPTDSPVISGGEPGPHKIQGIGAGFIPVNLNLEAIDEIIQVQNEEAYIGARDLARTEGALLGISSGAALFAATKIAQREKDKNILVILPDTGERYLSTELFNF